ncbi:right-handed parallel beta-helix repeat-containing protein [Microbulbifer sp. OS29]|uniref:Right-handed parallel beta-helix repeat-containing protein n=1 Tax=Microbulbifer okhotskensis TaxID=2926617 RepID=A0A9X2ESJ0_9GAMM|nr:right-handed parallel beta-helix repeat-containing protein [Microbulbifer okhotskensis]MCO1337000.1 right-handed parallel beta-helix repeat-containing protein [Microbulbifer okhotskensis]
MNTFPLKSTLRITITIALTASGFALTNQVLAVECGDVITAPATLNQNLICELTEDSPYGLTIIGPTGNLTMIDGGGVTCDNSSGDGIGGILLEGFSGLVTGGEIIKCLNGIIVAGDGFHSVLDAQISDTGRDAILINSHNNTITGNHIIGTEFDDGIDVKGSNNFISQNKIEASNDEGILIDAGADFNFILLNWIKGSIDGDDGIDIKGNYTTVSQNHVTQSYDNGISLSENVENSLVVQNTVSGNGIGGLLDSAGINITGFNNINNSIIGNSALNNSAFDLKDSSDPTCTGVNTWEGNLFTTSDPACLD